MNRKEELKILIENGDKKVAESNKLFENRLPYMEKTISSACRKLLKGVDGIDSSKYEFIISIGTGQVSIGLKGARFTGVSDIRVKRCESIYFDKSEEEIMELKHELYTNHSTGGLEQNEEEVEFIKEILRGLIAAELLKHKNSRALSETGTSSDFFREVEQVINEFYSHYSKRFQIETRGGLDKFKRELSEIEREERQSMLREAGEIKLPEGKEYSTYLKNSDKDRTRVIAAEFLKATKSGKVKLKITFIEQGHNGKEWVDMTFEREVLFDGYKGYVVLQEVLNETKEKVEEAA